MFVNLGQGSLETSSVFTSVFYEVVVIYLYCIIKYVIRLISFQNDLIQLFSNFLPQSPGVLLSCFRSHGGS